jgi:hypothetical protein
VNMNNVVFWDVALFRQDLWKRHIPEDDILQQKENLYAVMYKSVQLYYMYQICIYSIKLYV